MVDQLESFQVFHDASHAGEDEMQENFRELIKAFEERMKAEGVEEDKIHAIPMQGMFAGTLDLAYLNVRAHEFSEKHPEMAPDQIGQLVRDEIFGVVQRCKFSDYDVSDGVLTKDDEGNMVRRYLIKIMFRTRDDAGPYEYAFTFMHDMAGESKYRMCREWSPDGVD